MGGVVMNKAGFASGLSTEGDLLAAGRQVGEQLRAGLGGARADLALLFGTSEHADHLGAVASRLIDEGVARHVLGCTGEAVIGADREVEEGPALSAWAGVLPGVELRPIHLRYEHPEVIGWPPESALGASKALLMLADPFSFPADRLLQMVEQRHRGLRVVGGMASAGIEPGQNRLVLDGDLIEEGAVGCFLEGPIALHTLVSQGCRPIGRPLLVTQANANVIVSLGRRNALEVLRETLDDLDEDERQKACSNLHVGRVINEYQDTFRRGDFLVRNVMGVTPEGGLAITDGVRVGQTIQFHVRDDETATEDLRALLERLPRPASGALLFSCNGRGTRLFPEPHHDIGLVREILGPIPTAGFFAMGEIGPVGGKNFIHGLSASIAVFSPGEE